MLLAVVEVVGVVGGMYAYLRALMYYACYRIWPQRCSLPCYCLSEVGSVELHPRGSWRIFYIRRLQKAPESGPFYVGSIAVKQSH